MLLAWIKWNYLKVVFGFFIELYPPRRFSKAVCGSKKATIFNILKWGAFYLKEKNQILKK